MRLIKLFVLIFFFGSCNGPKNVSYIINDTTVLNGISDSVQVKKGDILTYSFETIPSADLFFNYSISDQKIIKYIKTESEYSNKNYNPDDDGGDLTLSKYIFKSNKKGTCTLIFSSFLHGQVEFQDTVEIIIK